MKFIIIALIIGYFVFLSIGIRMGHRPAEVVRMSLDGLRTAGPLMAILLLIGVLTGSWRSSGSIVPIAILGVTHASVPYAIYIYAIPLVHLIYRKLTEK